MQITEGLFSPELSRAIFLSFDVDGDGLISNSDLAALFELFQENYSLTDAEILVENILEATGGSLEKAKSSGKEGLDYITFLSFLKGHKETAVAFQGLHYATSLLKHLGGNSINANGVHKLATKFGLRFDEDDSEYMIHIVQLMQEHGGFYSFLLDDYPPIHRLADHVPFKEPTPLSEATTKNFINELLFRVLNTWSYPKYK